MKYYHDTLTEAVLAASVVVITYINLGLLIG